MADRIKEPLLEAEKETVAAPQGTPSGFRAYLPLLLMLALMPALAWAMTQFLLIPRLQKSLGAAPAAASHAGATETVSTNGTAGDKGAARQAATLTKMLVNVAGTMGSRYLLTSVTVVGASADFKTKVEKNEPQLRDAAMTLLATKTIVDLEKPGARNMVRAELIASFNNILGGGAVQDIYITEFAIQ